MYVILPERFSDIVPDAMRWQGMIQMFREAVAITETQGRSNVFC